MSRLLSYMVVKNEYDRYLSQTIENLKSFVDELLIYDDQSEDSPPPELLTEVPHYFRRLNNVPSFLENESQFRQAAWKTMEAELVPEDEDWIISLDADERLVPASRDAIDHAIDRTDVQGLWLPVREIWQDDEDGTFARTDGFWGTITALRLVAYHPGGEFVNKGMGGGSVPSYVTTATMIHDLEIYHYGYTREEDRHARYLRYCDRPGHNPSHIRSILEPPVLQQLNS